MNFDALSSQFLFSIVITLVSSTVLHLKVRNFQIQNFSRSKILLFKILTLAHKLIYLAIFGTILQISKMCKFDKLEFFCISQRIGTLRDV